MKKTILIIVLLFFCDNLYSQEYSISKIKEIINKYPNVFEAFSKININNISIDKFRQDSSLMEKTYDLFEQKYHNEFRFRKHKFRLIINFKYNHYLRDYYIKKFLRETKKMSEKKIENFIDSIYKNKELWKLYIDSAFNYTVYLDSVSFYSFSWKTTSFEYIQFHSKLLTQRGYDTIRAYYDRYYKTCLNFNEPVLNALINMGDPEVRAKYDSLFEAKLKLKEFNDNDFYILSKFTDFYRYTKYSKLLLNNEIKVYDYGYRLININDFIAYYYFPFYDCKSSIENIKLKDSMQGPNCRIYEDTCRCIKYKFKSSFEDFSKYYYDYAVYMEKKEMEERKHLKYKTEK